MAIIVLIIILTIWFIFRGRAVLQKLRIKWKHYRLFASMKKTEKNLQKALSKGTDKRFILDKLSDEFRNFLSILTGKNCRSMTAREFENDPIPLSDFFRSCDELRFSGADIDSQEIIKLLNDLRSFIEELENTKTDKQKEEENA